MKGHILVTGGAGFIGSNLAYRLLDEGFEVTIADNLTTGKTINLPEKARFIKMDISKKEDYNKLECFDFSAIMHLAAQSSGEISNEDPTLDLRVNTLGTLLLLNFCKEKGIKRFIYASSMAVYGNADFIPVSENHSLSPLSFYGISKMSSEHYIQHYSNEGLDTTCFRMFSVYGPGQDLSNMKQGMVSIFMAYILKNEEVWVKGSDKRFRDLIYIDDVVNAWINSIDNPKTFGKIYNLGTGVKTTIKELVDMELKVFGKDPETYPVKYEGSTPADQYGLYANMDLFLKDTEWKPVVNLEIGLKKMALWTNNQKNM